MRSAVALVFLAGCITFDGGGQPASTPDAPTGNDATLPTDTPLDATLGCSNFANLPGGQSGHKYRPVTTSQNWNAQQTACASMGGYLAIPDSAGELQAFFNIVGLTMWVGVNDIIAENTFVDVKNQPYTALTPAGNQLGDDCVATSDGIVLDVDSCNVASFGMCECDGP